MLRRLHAEQPESFAFTEANREWAQGQIAKYPEGRQASAVVPLLWRAQEQEGWVTKPAIEEVARMLDMAYIRVLEVATFYFMFQLQPTGSVAHVQVCGTTSCMICGAEELMAVCREKIAPHAHQVSADGKFSWEEVECLGACANAPMVQIGKDYYEDLTAEGFGDLLDAFGRGEVPLPGPQNGRFASEPAGGLTSLDDAPRDLEANVSVTLAERLGDTVARITGDEQSPRQAVAGVRRRAKAEREEAEREGAGREETDHEGAGQDRVERRKPEGLAEARSGAPDDLKRIKGVGPALEAQLHALGVFHLDQIAAWSPEEVAWVDENLEGFHGRVSRDGWVEQARQLTETLDGARQ